MLSCHSISEKNSKLLPSLRSVNGPKPIFAVESKSSMRQIQGGLRKLLARMNLRIAWQSRRDPSDRY